VSSAPSPTPRHITSWHPDDMIRCALYLDASWRKRHVVGVWLRVSRDKERTRKPSTKVAATRVKSNLRRKKSCVGGVRRGGQSDVVRQIFSSIVTRFHHASYFLIPHLIPMGETCIFYYYFHCSRSITGGKESREELEECL
jgi:hypothetical protein